MKESIVRVANLSADGLAVEQQIESGQEGYVHELHVAGLRSAEDEPLAPKFALSPPLNQIPSTL